MRHLCIAALFALAAPVSAQPSDGSFKRPDVTIHYTCIGKGVPVVMLSGGPGINVDYLKPVAEGLKGCRFIMFEQRGINRSIPPAVTEGTYTVGQFVEDLEALRKNLHLAKLNLIGHSWGGMLSMAYAAKYPNQVGWMILLDSGGPTVDFFAPFGDNIGMRLTKEDQDALNKANASGDQGGSLFAYFPGYFFDRAKALKYRDQLDPHSMHGGILGAVLADAQKHGYDSRPGLRKVKCPVLILMGRQDPIDQSTEYGIRDSIAGSKLDFVERAGHFPWVESPTEFFEKMNAFLEKVAR